MTAPVRRGRPPRERALPWCAVREHREVEAVNGPSLVVRGLRRHAVEPTLWSLAVHGEIAPTLPQALAAALLPGRRLVGRQRILQGRSPGEFERAGHRDRDLSEQAAAHVAAELLGLRPTIDGEGAVVLDVHPDGPSAGLLTPGDVVVGAGDAVVRNAAALAAALGRGVDRLLVLRATRGNGSGLPEPVRLRDRCGGPAGLQVATHRPRPVGGLDVDADAVCAGSSGSSLGLVLALALLDVLTPGSLTGGRHVAVTGAVDVTGRVGAVGGVREKARAASRLGMELLLVPAGDAEEARRGALGAALQVVPIATVREAVDVLVAAGGDAPRLPVPGSPPPGAPRGLPTPVTTTTSGPSGRSTTTQEQ